MQECTPPFPPGPLCLPPDPSEVGFTEMVMDTFGWQPPAERTGFDLLPLVLQVRAGAALFVSREAWGQQRAECMSVCVCACM